MVKRREFLWDLGAGLATLGLEATGQGSQATPKRSDFMTPAPRGRTFASIGDARRASLKPGDVVLVRDLDQIAPSSAWTRPRTRGKWQLRRYRLSDGQAGNLLVVNDPAKDNGPLAVPPEFEVKLDLPGWYAMWVGVPMIELRPILESTYGGVDVALDNDPGYMALGPERGTRHGKIMGPMNLEVNCYWKCAKLDGRTLRLRVPYGTYLSQPWGFVRGSMSSLRLVRLSHEQVKAYYDNLHDQTVKRVIAVTDGFGHYWGRGEPGKGVDVECVEQYRDTNVKMYFLQTPSTGVASWPSRVTALLGEGVTEEEWKFLRRGDRRAYEYVQWAVKNGQEGYRVLSRICRESGPELHASLRMNLFWQEGNSRSDPLVPTNGKLESTPPWHAYFNGRFWHEHPELRKPGSAQLDYAQPRVRQFISDILVELATTYDLAGISMDFTRWPPVADPARHDFNVLTSFIKEVRQSLDTVAQSKGRKIALSAQVVDGYHAKATLAEQKIDLEAWLASRALDFICVQALDNAQYLAWAKRYHTPYYLINDGAPFTDAQYEALDPEYEKGLLDHDPLPGEEFQEQPFVSNTPDPTEWDAGFLERYRLGIDGVCMVNAGGSFFRRAGHVEEMAERVKTKERWGQREGLRIEVS